MARARTRTPTLYKLGYGLLAAYAAGMVVLALGVKVDLSTLFQSHNDSERLRNEVKNGRMLISTGGNMECRSIRFDNETVQLSRETLTDCGDQLHMDARSGGQISVFRDGFTKR
jgi:hypothetical protein